MFCWSFIGHSNSENAGKCFSVNCPWKGWKNDTKGLIKIAETIEAW